MAFVGDELASLVVPKFVLVSNQTTATNRKPTVIV